MTAFVRRPTQAPAALSKTRRHMGFEPKVLAQSALWTGAIAGGTRSPAVAATGRTVGGSRSLSEGRAGKQRDQRESSDKRFHDASPFTDDCPRFLQQQSADGPCFAVASEVGLRDLRLNHIFGYAAPTNDGPSHTLV